MKINDPLVGANFDPRAIIWTILVEVHYTMFDAKYLTSSLCQLWEDFSSFYYIHIRKTYDPRGWADFDTRGKILTALVEYL
jgi:hypothetical protein